MHCKYLPQDFSTRMDNGVCYYDAKPVFIMGSSEVAIVLGTYPEGKVFKTIAPNDPLLDLASPKLGYVNYKGSALYVYRKPERKYKQTLSYGAISYFDPSVKNGEARTWSTDQVFHGMKEMLLDKYPKIESALASLTTEKVTSIAISRNIAIVKDSYGVYRIFYKMEEVGYIKPGQKILHIPTAANAWVASKYLTGYGWEID